MYSAAIIAAGKAISVDHNEARVKAFEEINVEPKEFNTKVGKWKLYEIFLFELD